MSLSQQLRELLGSEIVADDSAALAAHSGDKWFASETPEVVVFARSTNDVASLLRFASREKIPVTPRGAGYGYVGGCVPVRRGIALSMMRMNRIKEIHFADAVAVVEPGVLTGDLKAAAREQRLFYPPDPASQKDCSIGGNIATNAGGPRCLKYGVTRNYVLGFIKTRPASTSSDCLSAPRECSASSQKSFFGCFRFPPRARHSRRRLPP